MAQGNVVPRLDRVAVVRALPGLGDFLTAVPAFRSLRNALPHAQIDLVGLNAAAPLVGRFSRYIDHLVPFPGYPGIPEVPVGLQNLSDFLSVMRADPYDLVLQMHGDGTHMNSFVLSFGAKSAAGFFPAGTPCPDPLRFVPYRPDESEIRRMLRLLETIGIPADSEQLEFPLTPLDRIDLDSVPELRGLKPGSYAVVHAGASGPEKRWDPASFALVGDRLAEQELDVILTGTPDELEIALDVASEMLFPSMVVAGRTSLGALAALISGAALLVANDTGVSHLAAALAVPSVVVFQASDPSRWAPLDRERHRVVTLSAREGQLDGTSTAGMALVEAAGLEEIASDGFPMEQVMAQVEDLLATGGTDVS